MPAIVQLLMTIVPLIPRMIEAGQATVDIFNTVQKIIDENRSPDQAEWDQLEAMISQAQQTVRDTSRDV